MAIRFLLKTKQGPTLSLQLLHNSISVLTRPVSTIAQLDSTNEAPQLSLNKASLFPMILGMSQKAFAGVGNGGFSLASGGALFARQIGTGRSSSKPRGDPGRDGDDDDYDDDFDGSDVDVDDVDDFDENADDDDSGDEDFDDIEVEEEENPKKKKANRRY